MSFITEKELESLENLSSSIKKSDVSYDAFDCLNSCWCSGDCGQSCSGGCETGCSGSCGRSCSGSAY